MALQSVGRLGCSVRRTPAMLSWLLCCLLLVTACSSGHPRGTAAPAPLLGSAKGAVTVPVTASGALATTAAWQVRMAATTSAGTGATLTIAHPGATAPAVAPPAGLRPGSDPARFELVGAQLGANGAMVTRKLSAPVPVDQQASLAYFDEKARTWVSVPTVVSADRRQLTAHTVHFSIWDDIYYGIGAGITKRADAPSCSGATPSWVRDTTFFDDLNAPLQWCAGRDPKNPQWLVVKVVASRAYGFLMRPAVTPQWTYSSFLHDVPGAADLVTAGIDKTLRLPDLLQPMDGGVFLAPGAEVDFGFTEQQVRSLKTTELVSADPSITWMLAGSMYSAVSAVNGKDNAKFAYAYSLVAALQCAHDLVKANSAVERSTAFVTCLASNAKDIYSAALDLAAKAGMDTKVAATKIPAVAAVSLGVAAASVGAQIGEWFTDQTQPPESRALSVSLQLLRSSCTADAVRADLPGHPRDVAVQKCHMDWAVADVCASQCVDAGKLLHLVDGHWKLVGAVLQDCEETLTGQGVPSSVAAQFGYPRCNSLAPAPGVGAGKYCGLVHGFLGEARVSIVSGPVQCGEALHIVDTYYNHPPSPPQGSGGFLAFDGWECISTSGAVSQETGHYSDCEKGTNTNVGNGNPIGSAISVDRA